MIDCRLDMAAAVVLDQGRHSYKVSNVHNVHSPAECAEIRKVCEFRNKPSRRVRLKKSKGGCVCGREPRWCQSVTAEARPQPSQSYSRIGAEP